MTGVLSQVQTRVLELESRLAQLEGRQPSVTSSRTLTSESVREQADVIVIPLEARDATDDKRGPVVAGKEERAPVLPSPPLLEQVLEAGLRAVDCPPSTKASTPAPLTLEHHSSDVMGPVESSPPPPLEPSRGLVTSAVEVLVPKYVGESLGSGGAREGGQECGGEQEVVVRSRSLVTQGLVHLLGESVRGSAG